MSRVIIGDRQTASIGTHIAAKLRKITHSIGRRPQFLTQLARKINRWLFHPGGRHIAYSFVVVDSSALAALLPSAPEPNSPVSSDGVSARRRQITLGKSVAAPTSSGPGWILGKSRRRSDTFRDFVV